MNDPIGWVIFMGRLIYVKVWDSVLGSRWICDIGYIGLVHDDNVFVCGRLILGKM